jgi:L-ascorbate metabolism protein UlaG (beta-lactamase superfamily)
MRYARILTMLYQRLKMNASEQPGRRPQKPIPVLKPEIDEFMGGASKAIWFGHSTVLLQVDGKLILCDPVLFELFYAFTLFTGKRFTRELPLTAAAMPMIDVLLLSHDHYDHMDYQTIKALKYKVKHYCVPEGVGKRLEKWGIARNKISQCNYGQTVDVAGLAISCTPGKHFSGRGLRDRNKTLWCSWVITGKKTNIFFSGDSAYGPHFKMIGDTYGPFDITFVECGQANALFGHVHMIREKAVQAQIDLRGRVMVPIHWGMLSQSNPDWNEQVERLLTEAQAKAVPVITPMIGEMIAIGEKYHSDHRWWQDYR